MSLDVRKIPVLPNMQEEHCNNLSFLNILHLKQGTPGLLSIPKNFSWIREF